MKLKIHSPFVLILLLVSTFVSAETKTAESKPSLPVNRQYPCFFRRASDSAKEKKVYEFKMRTPDTEEYLNYQETNRATLLKVRVEKTGWVDVEYLDQRAQKTLAQGRIQVNFEKPFIVNLSGPQTWQLDCR